MCAAVGKVKLGAASSPALLLSLRLGWSPRGPAWGEHPQCWFNQGGVGSSPSRGAREGSASPAPASPALWGTQRPKCRKSPRPSPVLTHTGTEGPQVTSPGPAGHPWVPPRLAPCALRAPHVPLLQPHSSQGHPRGSPPCVLLGIWGSKGTKKRLGGTRASPPGALDLPTCHCHLSIPAPCPPGWEGAHAAMQGLCAPPAQGRSPPGGVPILLSTPGEEAGGKMWGRPTATAAWGPCWGPRVAKTSPMRAQHPRDQGPGAPSPNPCSVAPCHGDPAPAPALRLAGTLLMSPSLFSPSPAPPGARGGEGSRARGQVPLWLPPSPDAPPWRAA